MGEKQQKIAHAKPLPDGGFLLHSLEEHLLAVGDLSKGFAEAFGNGDWGEAAGLWHDLGKYKGDFQEYIRKVTGYERDEAEEGGSGNDLSLTAGERNSQSDLQFSNSLLENLIGAHSLRWEFS